MTHLIAVRTVTDVDGKPFQVADVIEDTATLPHSVLLYEYFDPQWECRADFLANMVDVVNSTEPAAPVELMEWQNTPEYKEAKRAADNFDFESIQEQEF